MSGRDHGDDDVGVAEMCRIPLVPNSTCPSFHQTANAFVSAAAILSNRISALLIPARLFTTAVILVYKVVLALGCIGRMLRLQLKKDLLDIMSSIDVYKGEGIAKGITGDDSVLVLDPHSCL